MINLVASLMYFLAMCIHLNRFLHRSTTEREIKRKENGKVPLLDAALEKVSVEVHFVINFVSSLCVISIVCTAWLVLVHLAATLAMRNMAIALRRTNLAVV